MVVVIVVAVATAMATVMASAVGAAAAAAAVAAAATAEAEKAVATLAAAGAMPAMSDNEDKKDDGYDDDEATSMAEVTAMSDGGAGVGGGDSLHHLSRQRWRLGQQRRKR